MKFHLAVLRFLSSFFLRELPRMAHDSLSPTRVYRHLLGRCYRFLESPLRSRKMRFEKLVRPPSLLCARKKYFFHFRRIYIKYFYRENNYSLEMFERISILSVSLPRKIHFFPLLFSSLPFFLSLIFFPFKIKLFPVLLQRVARNVEALSSFLKFIACLLACRVLIRFIL